MRSLPTAAGNRDQIETNEARAHDRVIAFGLAMLVAYLGLAASLFLIVTVANKTDRNHKNGLVIRHILNENHVLLVRIDALERKEKR